MNNKNNQSDDPNISWEDLEKSEKADSKTPNGNGDVPPNSVTIPATEFEKLEKEAAEYRDKYLRALAESENARKRLQKEREELVQYAVANAIVDFLHPLDNFENALKYSDQMSDDVKHWAVGFQMILKQFKEALNNNGVIPFESIGKPFDPHHHEAVEMVTTTESPPGTVIDESVKGYRMGKRTIRPARVRVSKSPETKNENKPQETKENQKDQSKEGV